MKKNWKITLTSFSGLQKLTKFGKFRSSKIHDPGGIGSQRHSIPALVNRPWSYFNVDLIQEEEKNHSVWWWLRGRKWCNDFQVFFISFMTFLTNIWKTRSSRWLSFFSLRWSSFLSTIFLPLLLNVLFFLHFSKHALCWPGLREDMLRRQEVPTFIFPTLFLPLLGAFPWNHRTSKIFKQYFPHCSRHSDTQNNFYSSLTHRMRQKEQQHTKIRRSAGCLLLFGPWTRNSSSSTRLAGVFRSRDNLHFDV